jgi:hypothetical protein
LARITGNCPDLVATSNAVLSLGKADLPQAIFPGNFGGLLLNGRHPVFPELHSGIRGNHQRDTPGKVSQDFEQDFTGEGQRFRERYWIHHVKILSGIAGKVNRETPGSLPGTLLPTEAIHPEFGAIPGQRSIGDCPHTRNTDRDCDSGNPRKRLLDIPGGTLSYVEWL